MSNTFHLMKVLKRREAGHRPTSPLSPSGGKGPFPLYVLLHQAVGESEQKELLQIILQSPQKLLPLKITNQGHVKISTLHTTPFTVPEL